MLLTFVIKHGRDFLAELAKARLVAEFALQTGSVTSKDVKDIGLPSAIANQVLRKYSRNDRIKAVSKVVLTVPGQGVKRFDKELYIFCLKLHLDISHLPEFEKVNQVEVGKEFAYVTVTIDEPPLRDVEHWMGIDLNSTGHIAVAGRSELGQGPQVWQGGPAHPPEVLEDAASPVSPRPPEGGEEEEYSTKRTTRSKT